MSGWIKQQIGRRQEHLDEVETLIRNRIRRLQIECLALEGQRVVISAGEAAIRIQAACTPQIPEFQLPVVRIRTETPTLTPLPSFFTPEYQVAG